MIYRDTYFRIRAWDYIVDQGALSRGRMDASPWK